MCERQRIEQLLCQIRRFSLLAIYMRAADMFGINDAVTCMNSITELGSGGYNSEDAHLFDQCSHSQEWRQTKNLLVAPQQSTVVAEYSVASKVLNLSAGLPQALSAHYLTRHHALGNRTNALLSWPEMSRLPLEKQGQLQRQIARDHRDVPMLMSV